MRILTFSSLYPNIEMPHRGVFVENRLRHLIKDTDIESRVVAPVPWFPLSKMFNEEYKRFSQVPEFEERHTIPVFHPRYFHLPKVGMMLQPFLMALAAYPVVKKIIRNGYDFELIDAHYFYPDGVAAVLLGKWLGKPVVITARGTDLNLIPQYFVPKLLIKYAAMKANALITVCQALKDVLVEMQVPDNKIMVLRNGVDLQVFRPPEDREGLRSKMDFNGTTILSVGYLIERKGHDLIIRALKYLPGVKLLIAGDGEERDNLRALVKSEGVEDRVSFLGNIPHENLKDYYGAADILVLASSREGWANVLLESMACGTPVVATNIWGTPEVVSCPEAGVLVARETKSIADGVKTLLADYPDRSMTRKHAERFEWNEVSIGQQALFGKLVNR